jgi:hypothetical protein
LLRTSRGPSLPSRRCCSQSGIPCRPGKDGDIGHDVRFLLFLLVEQASSRLTVNDRVARASLRAQHTSAILFARGAAFVCATAATASKQTRAPKCESMYHLSPPNPSGDLEALCRQKEGENLRRRDYRSVELEGPRNPRRSCCAPTEPLCNFRSAQLR